MKYFEFGQQNETLMVLLHGGVCYKGVLPVAQRLAKDFHVVVVAYDGFNPSEPDTEFLYPSWMKRSGWVTTSWSITVEKSIFWMAYGDR